MTWLRAVSDLALEVIRREGSPAGRVNLVVLMLSLAAVVGTGAGNILQALVRVFDADYSAGLPSFVALMAMFFLTLLGCVAILAAAEAARR